MKMSGKDDWDVEQHKTEHECDEHWELRRKFLLAHKDKFPEDELVCLAQVFTNVELLGCRYPKKTMQLIAELAEDIVTEYREKQKTKLQRTFVKASDAASSKVKGTNAPRSSNTPTVSTGYSTGSKSTRGSSSRDASLAKRRKVEDYPFGDIVMIERPGDLPQQILAAAINVSRGHLEWKFEEITPSHKCSIFVNSKFLAEACGPTQKSAKKEASIAALTQLQKYYYTIKFKQHGGTKEINITSSSMMDAKKTDSISDDNIGKKLMKLMGWTGGGLGKSEQGMVEPVTLKQQISKKGLGLKSTSDSTKDLKYKAKDIMRKYLSGEMMNDLVFSSDFTNEERAIIHQMARQMGLKSQSFGPKNQRTLIVSRKVDIKDLIEELKSLGGATDKYQLIEPTKQYE